jgi:hypothetical protein
LYEPTGQSPQNERLSPVTEYLPLGQQVSGCLSTSPVNDAPGGRKIEMIPTLPSNALLAMITELWQLNNTETRLKHEANAKFRTVITDSGTDSDTIPVD